MTGIAISSGHGKYIRGASGSPVPPQLDEVDEARKVVADVAGYLRQLGVTVYGPFNDDISTTQSQNLDRIVDWHNSQPSHDLDISVHFNAYDGSAQGVECLYVTQEELAFEVSSAIAAAGHFVNRGPKYRSDLAFLNGTNEPAILIETCFCDNTSDSNLYNANFDAICRTISETVSGRTLGQQPPVGDLPSRPPGTYPVLQTSGKTSWFGGPEDTGVSPSEGLAFIYEYSEAPYLFLPYQPEGTTGLARRLDPQVNYIAMRWDYDIYPKEMLASGRYLAKIRAPSTGKEFMAWPADWGPHVDTNRVCDISQGLMTTLGVETDDEVEVEFPSEFRPSRPDRPPPEAIPSVIVHISADNPVTVKVELGANVSGG